MVINSQLPDTNDTSVMHAAIAFEIAKAAMSILSTSSLRLTPEKLAKEFTDIYLTTRQSISSGKKESDNK